MRLFLSVCIMLCTLAIFAQRPNGQRPGFKIQGTVVETGSQQPVEFATIVANHISSGKMLSGTTTDIDGKFMLNVPEKDVVLEISFIGFTPKEIKDIQFAGKIADLGSVSLGEDALTLDEVVVTAERSTTEFKLDKRVFNVGSDLSNTGAGALEVLNNVPSVNVSIEGEVSLRGATGVQMLINGKPSILADEAGNALGTITADMIEKVEVITNPSAKYEAEGSAGIINIVLKKEEKKGMNGSITLNTGTPHNHSVGLSLNRRTEKFNLFTQLGMGYRELPNDVENINRNIATGQEIVSSGEQFRNETFYNAILGTDYYIDENNVITLSGSFAYEIEDQPSETNFESFQDGVLSQQWLRTESTEADNPKLQYEFRYKRDFKDNKDHQLQFSAIGNYFGKDQSSDFLDEYSLGGSDVTQQRTATNFKEGKYTFNLDYTKPIDDHWTIETGAQYLLNDVSNDFMTLDLEDGEYVVDPNLSNVFEYDQKVLGVYGTAAYEGELWGVKLGLRAENTDLSTLLLNTDQANDQNFTNLFPSAHTSYKFSDAVSVQAGYSRRIYRPRLWDLNPFFNIRNNFSRFEGNPELQPEYTDSYETGVIFILDQISMNVNLYHRYTTDKIERVSIFEDNVNIYRPENIGTSNNTGIETNFKYNPVRALTFNGDFNFNVFVRNGTFNDQVFDFDAEQWSAKLMTKIKASKSLDVEVTARHRSSVQTVQGENAANTWADLGLRYKIMKGRGIFSFSVRDVFASRVRERVVDQPDFYLLSSRQRGRFITLGFSYGFGKGEAMEYSGRRRR